MRNKTAAVSFSLSVIFITALLFIGSAAARNNLRDCLLALPGAGGKTPIKKLEEINGDGLLLSYENTYEMTATALGSRHGATVKGTNHTFPYVMGYGLLSGGFFKEDAADNKSRVAVLNKKAAFDMFGSFDTAGNTLLLNGERYLICGVINDEDEDGLNIYLPAVCLDEATDSVVINSASGEGLTAEYAASLLKDRAFADIGLIINSIGNIASASVNAAVFGIFLLTVKLISPFAIKYARDVRIQASQYYLRELLFIKSKPVQKLALTLSIFTGITVLSAALLLNTFKSFLAWRNAGETVKTVYAGGFITDFNEVKHLFDLSNIFFAGFVMSFAIFILSVWERKTAYENKN